MAIGFDHEGPAPAREEVRGIAQVFDATGAAMKPNEQHRVYETQHTELVLVSYAGPYTARP